MVKGTFVVGVRGSARHVQRDGSNVSPSFGMPKMPMIICHAFVACQFQFLELIVGYVMHAVHGTRIYSRLDIRTVALVECPRATMVLYHLEGSGSCCDTLEYTGEQSKNSKH